MKFRSFAERPRATTPWRHTVKEAHCHYMVRIWTALERMVFFFAAAPIFSVHDFWAARPSCLWLAFMEQRRKEAEERVASKAAGQLGKKHLTARSPCAARTMSKCDSKYSQGTGSICSDSNCGLWLCPGCAEYGLIHTTTAHEYD